MTDDLEQPNGLIGTPDGKLLYVADIRGRKTYRYNIEKNGHLTNKQLFCSLGSDGMTLDDVEALKQSARNQIQTMRQAERTG